MKIQIVKLWGKDKRRCRLYGVKVPAEIPRRDSGHYSRPRSRTGNDPGVNWLMTAHFPDSELLCRHLAERSGAC